SFEPADAQAWGAQLAWEGADVFLNLALGRPGDAKFSLYEWRGGRGRIAWTGDDSSRSASITEYAPNRVTIDGDSTDGGTLILTDLAYPGWQATRDGRPVPAMVVEGLFRGVDIP